MCQFGRSADLVDHTRDMKYNMTDSSEAFLQLYVNESDAGVEMNSKKRGRGVEGRYE